MNKKAYPYLLLIIILAGGTFYRIHSLDHDSFWMDESYTILAAKNIETYKIPQFDSGQSYWRAWPQTFLLYEIGHNYGYNPIPMRIPSVIMGIAVIILLFAIIKRHYDLNLALIVAALTSLSYYQIAWSRQARMYIFLEFFFILAIGLYLEFYKTKKIKWIILSILSTAITYLFHPEALLIPVIILTHYITTQEHSKLKEQVSMCWTKYKKYVPIPITVLILFLYAIRSNLSVISFGHHYFFYYTLFIIKEHNVLLIFAILGLYITRKNSEINMIWIYMGWYILLICSFLVTMMNYRYIFLISPVIIILASQGIKHLITYFNQIKYRIIISVVIITLLCVAGTIFLPKENYPLEPGTPQPSFKEAYEFLHTQNITQDNTLIVTQTAIAKIYNYSPTYWLQYSFSGLEEPWAIVNNTEIYTGIPVIQNSTELHKIINRTSGYIIIDGSTLQGISNDTKQLITNQTLLFSTKSEMNDSVYIFKYTN